ncbi:pitrilysin family protein [Emcibacter sp.]|uniref:M16 family metallopeptidase n=1 Tax=Emcibacter sp. TaxID=1979954 RepID=UPI002AA9440C|nr:pitrilysin family protein [Emcibacter sp.]
MTGFPLTLKSLTHKAAIAVAVLTVLLVAATARSEEPIVDSFMLENGMKVVVIPDHRAPIVTHMVWYNVGAADDPKGHSGLAHFLEHMLFKRTKKLAEGEYSRIVARNGGRHNAFTSADYTGYYQTVAVDRLPLMMELEADRMVNLVLDEQDVLSERDVVLEERSMRIDSQPMALLREQMAASLFTVHPYGIPIAGWRSELENLSLKDVRDFYDKYYNPANAILVVAGDVTTDHIRTLANKYYQPLKGTPLPKRVRSAEPEQTEAKRVDYRDERVQQPTWLRSYHAPSYSAGEKQYAPALDVLSEILGSGVTSRLYQKLVVEQRVAVAAGSQYSSTSYDPDTFLFYAIPRPGLAATPEESLDILEKATDAVIAEMLEKGITDEELSRVKNGLVAEMIYARDSNSTMAQIFGQALTTGSSIEDVLNWPDDIRAVTTEDVLEAARYVLDQRKSVTGRLLPQAAPAEAGEVK